jgi:hypothetical protein
MYECVYIYICMAEHLKPQLYLVRLETASKQHHTIVGAYETGYVRGIKPT